MLKAVAKLEEYISVGTKRMRCGYTTGTCAAAATRAAAELLVGGRKMDALRIDTPAGIEVDIDIELVEQGANYAQCAVRKDAGDDPDVTDGALVFARVEWRDEPGVTIDGGTGVGRVTSEGLDQPVGAAAINHVPRQMIERQVQEVLAAARADAGLAVTISIPAGIELAKKTFNPRLGIEGGISVLGTSGIVRPMSETALIASIDLECSVLRARDVKDLLVCPGNYGRDYARDVLGLDMDASVQCSNYLGATLDSATTLGFDSVLIVGHIGKMAKVAAGIMNTHSRVADGRLETIAAHAALCGADQNLARVIMDCATTDAALDALADADLLERTMQSLVGALQRRLRARAGQGMQVEALVFSSVRKTLGLTSGARDLLDRHRREQIQQVDTRREGELT